MATDRWLACSSDFFFSWTFFVSDIFSFCGKGSSSSARSCFSSVGSGEDWVEETVIGLQISKTSFFGSVLRRRLQIVVSLAM